MVQVNQWTESYASRFMPDGLLERPIEMYINHLHPVVHLGQVDHLTNLLIASWSGIACSSSSATRTVHGLELLVRCVGQSPSTGGKISGGSGLFLEGHRAVDLFFM